MEFFTTAADLNASAEFLKRADIQNLTDAFNLTGYAISAPAATGTPMPTATATATPEPEDTGSIETDRAALVALYNATDGENWANNENWLSDRPLWDWYGVNTDHLGRVSWLGLWDNELTGSIPPELGSLTNLEGLYLGGNELTGSIPPPNWAA